MSAATVRHLRPDGKRSGANESHSAALNAEMEFRWIGTR